MGFDSYDVLVYRDLMASLLKWDLVKWNIVASGLSTYELGCGLE